MPRSLPCLTVLALAALVGCEAQPAARGPVVPVASTEQFDLTIGQANQPVLADFYAQWCGPCERLEPRLAELAAEYEGRVRFVRVDINDAPRLAKRYEIRRIPTILVISNGRVVRRMGYDSSAAYRKALNAALGATPAAGAM